MRIFHSVGRFRPCSGSVSDLAFKVVPQFAESTIYKIEEPSGGSSVATAGALAYQLNNRHGIRIIVRQSGAFIH